MDTCLACRAGQHQECDTPVEDAEHEAKAELFLCCCNADTPETSNFDGVQVIGAPGNISGSSIRDALTEGVQRTRRLKDSELVRDPTSTGRKEAARLYPITPGMVCEWAGLSRAGGGVVPIIGCLGTVLTGEKGNGAIHHGPDKATLNNSPGNVHRICTPCHNRWHTLNDDYYGKRPDGQHPFIPLGGVSYTHDDITLATDSQVEKDKQWWVIPKKVKENLNYRDYVGE